MRYNVEIPAGATTFDVTSFGMCQANGYNPSRVSGKMSDIPIRYLTEGQWLSKSEPGDGSGELFTVKDKDKKVMGTFYKPSWNVEAGTNLTFRPVTV